MDQEQPSAAATWTKALNELGDILRLDAGEASMRLEQACRHEPPRCQRCGCERIYRLARGRLRCAECRYSFQLFTGRWLGRHRLPATVWLASIKCFELGLGARELSQVAGLSLPTAIELLRTVQMSLAAMDPAWMPIVRACAVGAGVPHQFRVKQQGRGVHVEILPESGPDPRVELPPPGAPAEALRAFRAGMRRWLRLSPDRLALTLKEWEIRANQGKSLYGMALEALGRYMPAGVSDA